MPALPPVMEEGKFARRVKARGGAIRPGDAIAGIETDAAKLNANVFKWIERARR